MATTTGSQFVTLNVYDSTSPPEFQPRSISTLLNSTVNNSERVAAVRFHLDSASGRLRNNGLSAGLVESQGPDNPCVQREYGTNLLLGAEQWQKGYVELPLDVAEVPTARFFFAQIYPENNSDCLKGLWGAIDATTTEVQAFQDAIAASLTKPTNTSTTSRTNGSIISGALGPVIIIVSVLGFVAVFTFIYLFRQRLRLRRRKRDQEADERQQLVAESPEMIQSQAGLSTSTDTSLSSASLPSQVVEHFVQDENHRLVMRAASVSSLPVYTPPTPPPPIPLNPGRQVDPTGSRNGLREEAQDDVPLMVSPSGLSSTTVGAPPLAWRRGERRRERDRRRQRNQDRLPSPTRTVRSDAETLPEYMSMISRPPSFVSRMGTLG